MYLIQQIADLHCYILLYKFLYTKGSMKTKYENTLFYQINSCAKYFNKLFDQFFDELSMGLTSSEHLALGIIMETKDCCQRDLAKIILKDRANTGKLVNNLEQKGLIKIELKIKNNRPVKILSITKHGQNLWQSATDIIKPSIDKIKEKISDKEIEELIKTLKNFRKIVEKTVKVNI